MASRVPDSPTLTPPNRPHQVRRVQIVPRVVGRRPNLVVSLKIISVLLYNLTHHCVGTNLR